MGLAVINEIKFQAKACVELVANTPNVTSVLSHIIIVSICIFLFNYSDYLNLLNQ